MNRNELNRLQSERLVDIVKYTYERVADFRGKMDKIGLKPSDIKGIDDIAKLPFTVKEDMRANYPFGMFAAERKDIVRLHASSGTTGKLTVAGYTQRDLDDWAEGCARALTAAGADRNSIVHIAYGYGLFTGGLGMHYGAEKIGAAVVPVSSGNTPRQLQLMVDFGADILCCTPSYAIYLADEIEKAGIDKKTLKLRSGIFGAEPWSEEMRREIEERLNIKAYNIYGLSEISGPGVSFECSCRDGCHVNEDLFFPEIVDPKTLKPLPYGTEGELVFTTLRKEGMPLIRYRTRDICSLINEKCSCGREFIKMTRIFGRSDDMLIIRGVNIFPSQIESALLNIPELSAHYQIIADRQNSQDSIEISVEIKEEYFTDEIKILENLKRKAAAELLSAIGVNASIKIVPQNSIPRSEGKAVRVVDKRKLN
jgi:phenylacetate-CoA ligase